MWLRYWIFVAFTDLLLMTLSCSNIENSDYIKGSLFSKLQSLPDHYYWPDARIFDFITFLYLSVSGDYAATVNTWKDESFNHASLSRHRVTTCDKIKDLTFAFSCV